MGIINFFIVLFYNIIWLKEGRSNYINMHNGNYSTWLSIAVWFYQFWGIANLIYSLL